VTTALLEFGRRLRDERERRGLALQAIADSTKIPLALLAGLERGDLADWPHGLFGRAHFRAYVTAVGVSPEPLMNEFLRLCGQDTAPPPAPCPPAPDDGLRLTLAEDRRWDFRSAGLRVLAVALDVCGILAIALVFVRNFQADLPLASALVGVSYYALATLALGQSVTLWWLGGRVLQRGGRSPANVRTGLLLPRRGLRASRRQESPIDFGDHASASVAQTASR
jgi:transcriptional regulator with XRE-family HTH domain